MNETERLGQNLLIPVVVIEDADNAVATAKALLAGGIDVMEITLRTAAAMEAIKRIAAQVPEMLVGAGTVLTLEQGQAAVTAGARFLVSPGFDAELVRWAVAENIPVTPGCVTPTEIMGALALGVDIIKFFPANVYGGLKAMKGLSGPFQQVRFIPTGGVNAENVGEYSAAPFVFAVGGSWVCAKKDIRERNFEKITSLCRQACVSALQMKAVAVNLTAQELEEAKTALQEMLGAELSWETGESGGEGKGLRLQVNNARKAEAFLKKIGAEDTAAGIPVAVI